MLYRLADGSTTSLEQGNPGSIVRNNRRAQSSLDVSRNTSVHCSKIISQDSIAEKESMKIETSFSRSRSASMNKDPTVKLASVDTSKARVASTSSTNVTKVNVRKHSIRSVSFENTTDNPAKSCITLIDSILDLNEASVTAHEESAFVNVATALENSDSEAREQDASDAEVRETDGSSGVHASQHDTGSTQSGGAFIPSYNGDPGVMPTYSNTSTIDEISRYFCNSNNIQGPLDTEPEVKITWLPPSPLSSTNFSAIPTYVDSDARIYLHPVSRE